ncbi:hypothetical protein WME89_07900 [Sorangium sp. So ce321]|uniref:hypothetical protein n=1 Tax=Sorangium sp. So ce321 TaxID=3133300 RepID=UPI003F5E4E3C
MNIKSTIATSAAALALGAVVVNSSAAPALASEEPSPSHIAQMAAATEAVEAERLAFPGLARAALQGAAWGVGWVAGQRIARGRAVDSTSALAATSDALFDYR